jgi:hypothetical protein
MIQKERKRHATRGSAASRRRTGHDGASRDWIDAQRLTHDASMSDDDEAVRDGAGQRDAGGWRTRDEGRHGGVMGSERGGSRERVTRARRHEEDDCTEDEVTHGGLRGERDGQFLQLNCNNYGPACQGLNRVNAKKPGPH